MSSIRPIFEIYVDDDRYAVPTLHLIPAAGEVEALRMVEQLLLENPDHHLGAELCRDGHVLVVVGSFAARPRTRADALAYAGE